MEEFNISIKRANDEELIRICNNQNEYPEGYIDIVVEELVIRGYDIDKSSSVESIQQQALRKKSDLELFDLVENKKDCYPTLLIKQEFKNRERKIEEIEEEYFSIGVQGNYVILIGFPLLVFVIIPFLSLVFTGKVSTMRILVPIVIVTSFYYSLKTVRLLTGKRVKKYNEKTRKIAGIIVGISIALFVIGAIVFILN